MPSRPLYCATLLVLALDGAAHAQQPQTVAEKTDYRATSRHTDVLAFTEALAKLSPLVRLDTMGTSGDGRKLPLMILADPPVATPEEARRSGKLVVYAQANIHAGEVDGKEALLMLARDLTFDPVRPLLKDLVVLLCPNFNPDGNEPIDPAHRRNQNGPPEGVGNRENAAGLDLNRDFVKLDSPEVRSLVRLMNRWDPALVIDCHTTNGSHHRFVMTYDGPRLPAAGPSLVEFVQGKMLPEVGRALDRATGYKSFIYGNFSADRKVWTADQAQPRYSEQYAGVRGRIGILSESYAYAPFKDRVLGSKAFVRCCFDFAAAHKDDIRKLFAANTPGDMLTLRNKVVPQGEPATVLGFEEEMRNGRRVATDKPHDYEVKLVSRVEPAEQVSRPFAYLVPASFGKAIETMQRHGLTLEELREDAELNVEAYRVEKFNRSPRVYQRHNEVTLQVERPQTAARRIPAGTVVVRTAQPLGTLAGLLLEPRSEDGLATWNYFDAGLSDGGEFPVLRLPTPATLSVRPLRPLDD